MKHPILLGSFSCLSLLAAAQQKDLFNIDRHLQSKEKLPGSPQTTYSLPPVPVYSNKMSFQYQLPNGAAVYSQNEYRMPVIVPETSLDQIPNPGLSHRLKTGILFSPPKSGDIPNPAPLISL